MEVTTQPQKASPAQTTSALGEVGHQPVEVTHQVPHLARAVYSAPIVQLEPQSRRCGNEVAGFVEGGLLCSFDAQVIAGRGCVSSRP